MAIPVTRAKTLKPHPDPSTLGFGRFYSDHMFNMDYAEGKGWHNPRIEPYGPIPMDPASIGLQYAQLIFDGHKAYPTPQGGVQLFRPQAHIARLGRSSERMCIPQLDQAFVLQAMKELITIEQAWVPKAPGTALYVRPTIVATEPCLGVRASKEYRFYIFLSPVGPYFAEGFKPVKIWVAKDYVRAVRGGIGAAKAAANYACSLYAGELAHKQGYSQVLWLDGVERKYIEEVGAMNIGFMVKGEFVTPPLGGSILPGITRDSVLQLVRSWNMPVTERPISIDEVMQKAKTGEISECFGIGTAAVIAPVGSLQYGDDRIVFGDGGVGPMTQKLYTALTDIQYGRAPDPFGWMVKII